MKRWLVVLISLGFVVMSGKPALGGGAMHGRGPAGSFGGFGGSSPVRVGMPAMRLPPAAPGLTFARHGVSPGRGTAATPIIPEIRSRGEMAPTIRAAGIRPVGPKMIVIDSASGARAHAPTGRSTAGRPVPQPPGPKVLIVSDTIGSRSGGPIIIEVNPTAPVDSAVLIVEAAPEEAQVFLDGQLLGTAGQLAAQAVAISAGPHAIMIVSPPAEPFTAQFTAKPGFPTRIHVALAAR